MTKVQNTNVSAVTKVENKKVKKQQQKKEQQVFKGNGNKQTVQKPNDSALKQEIYKKTGFQLKDTKNKGQIINLKVNGRVRPYETVGTLTTGGRILVKEKGKEVYHVVSHTPDKKPVMLKDDYARNKVFYETTSAEHKVKIGKKNYIITNSKRDRHGRMTAINSRGQEVILSHDGKELKHSYVEAEDQKDNLNDYIAQQTKGKSKAEANKIRQQIMDGNSSYSSKGVLRFKASNGEVWYYDTKRKTYVKYAEKEAQAIIKDLDKGAKEDWWLFRTGLGTDYELLKNTNAQIIDPEVLNKINKHYSTEYGKKVDKNAEYGSGKYKTAYEAFLASEIGDDEVYLFNATLVKNKAITDQSRRNEILQTNLTKISGIGIEGLGVGVNKRANRMAAADAASTKEDYQTLQDAAEDENAKKNYKPQFKGQDALQTYIYGVHDGDVQEIDDFNNALIDPKEDMLDRDEIVRIKAETGVLWLKEGNFKKGFEAQDNDVTKQMFALQNPKGKAVLNANTLKQQAAKDKQEDYMMMARPDLYSDKELASRATQLLKDALLNLNNYHSIEFQSMRSQTGNYDILAQNKVDFKKDAEENISRAYSMIRNDKILAMVKKEMGNNYNLLVQREQEHLKTNNLKNITTITDTQVTKYTDNKGEVKLTPEQIAHNKYVVTWLKSQLSDIERDKKSNEAKEGWKQGFVNNTRDLLFGGVTRASLADKYNLIKSNMARLEAAAEGRLVDASGKPVSFEDAMKNLGETGIQALEQANAEYQTAQQIGEFMVDMVALAIPLPKSFNAANTVIKMGNALYKVISKSDKVCKVVKITQEAAKGSKIYEVTAKVATKNPKLVENTRKVATIMDSSATGAMHMAGKTLVLDATNIATSREGFTSDRISEMNEKVKSAGKFGGMGGAIGGTTGMLAEYVSSTGAKYVVHGLGLVADVTGAAGLMTAESHGETNFWDNLRCVNPDGSFNFEQATMTAMMIYGHLHGASTVRGKSKAQVFDEITTNNDLQLRYQKGNEGSYEYFNAEALKWEPTTKEFFNERVARDGVKREAHSVKLENRELRLDNDGIWSDAESGRKFRLAKDNNGRTQLAELTKKEIYNSRQKTEVKDGMTLEDFRQELKNNDLRGNVYTKADGGRLVVVKHSFNKYELYEFDTNNKMISQKSVKGKSAIKESYPEFANVESSGTIGSTSGYLGMNNPVGNGNKSKNVETLQDNVNKKELTALRNELGIKQSQKGSRFKYSSDKNTIIITEMLGKKEVARYEIMSDENGNSFIRKPDEYGRGDDATLYPFMSEKDLSEILKEFDIKPTQEGSVFNERHNDRTIELLERNGEGPVYYYRLELDTKGKPHIVEREPIDLNQKTTEKAQVKETSTANDKKPVIASENEAIQSKQKPAETKAESRFSESNINFSRTHEGFSQIEGNVKDVPDLRNAESFRNSKDGVGVVYLPKENATAIVVKISGRVNDNYTIMIDGKIPEEQCRALVKSLKDSGNNRFDRQQVADILNKQYEMAETSSVRPETHTEKSQTPKTEEKTPVSNDKNPIIASEGEAIQTKQKPLSTEVPKATPEQVAQVMDSLTVFSDQGARLAFVGKYSTECANIAKKELIYTVDEGKSVKYFPDKDISLIDESAITKEDTGRIGTFRIAVKGRVSEADAKALMEHLFDKGVIKRDADGRLLTKSVLINGNNEKLGEAISEFLANKKLNSQNPIGHSELVSGTGQPVKPTESEAIQQKQNTAENTPVTTTQNQRTGNTAEQAKAIHNSEVETAGVTPVQQTKAQQLELERLQTLVQSNEGKVILADAMKDPNFGKPLSERVPDEGFKMTEDGRLQIEVDGVVYTQRNEGDFCLVSSDGKILEDPCEGQQKSPSATDNPNLTRLYRNGDGKIFGIENQYGAIVYENDSLVRGYYPAGKPNTILDLSLGRATENYITTDNVGRVLYNYNSQLDAFGEYHSTTIQGRGRTMSDSNIVSDLNQAIQDVNLKNTTFSTKKGRQKAYEDVRTQIENAYKDNKLTGQDYENLVANLNAKAEKAGGLIVKETRYQQYVAKRAEVYETNRDLLSDKIDKVATKSDYDNMVVEINEAFKSGKIDREAARVLNETLDAKGELIEGVETLSQKKAKIEKQVREIETAQRIEEVEANSQHRAELLDEYLAEFGEKLPSEIGTKEYYDEALSTIDRGVKNGSIEPQKAEVLRTQAKEQLAKLESESNQPVTEPPATEKSVVGEKSQATQNPVNASEGEAIQSPFEITADKFVVNGNEQPIPTFEEAQRTLNKYGGNQYSIETGDGNRLIFRYDDNGKFIGSREEISINGKALKDTSRNADGTLDKTIDYFHTNDGEPVLIERDSNGNPIKIKWWKRNITFDKEGKASYEVTNEKNETINKPIKEVLKDSPELKSLLEKQGIKLVEESNSPVPPVVENKGEETPTSEKSGEGTPAPENNGEGSTPQKTPATVIEDKYPNVPKIEEVETNEGLQLRHKVGDENSYEFFEPEALKWEPTTKEFFEKMTSRDGVKSKATYQNIKNADGSTVQRFIDANGKKVKKIFRNKDGKVTGSNEYVYDVDGKMSKKISKNKDGKVSISTEYKYNEFGKESERIIKDGKGNVIYSEEYKYDKSGNQIEFIHKDENGKIINSTEYKYNEFGKKSEIIHKDENGNPEDSTVFKYDANGKLSLEYEKDSKGEIVSSEEYKYNADGELSKTITRDKDGNITIIYDDEQGHLLSPEETNNYIKKSLENDINNIKTKENVDEYIAELGEALEKKIITEEEYYDLVKQAGEKRKAEEAAKNYADEVEETNNEGQPVTIELENTPDGFPKVPSKPEQLEKKTLEEILGDEKAPKTADEAKEYAKAHEDAEFVVDKDPNNCNKLFLDKKQNNIVFYNKDGSIQSYREISPSKGVRRRDTVLNPDGTVKSVKTRATNGDLKVEYYEKGNLTQKELYSNENNVWTDHEVYFDSEGNMKGAKKFVQNNETWEQTAEYEYNTKDNVFEQKNEKGEVESTVKYDEATEHWAEFDAEGKVVHEINKPEPVVVESESASAGEETPVGENSETADTKPSKISMFDKLFHRNKVRLENEVEAGTIIGFECTYKTQRDENGYVRTETDQKTNVVRQKEYFNAKGKKIKTEVYYDNGKLKELTEGNVTTTYYDNGNVRIVKYPNHKEVKFRYDDNGNLIARYYEEHNPLHPKNWIEPENEDGSIDLPTKRSSTYKYNSKDHRFELLDENDKVVTDKNGNPVGTATFDPETRHWVEKGQYSSDLAPKTTNVSRGNTGFRARISKATKNIIDKFRSNKPKNEDGTTIPKKFRGRDDVTYNSELKEYTETISEDGHDSRRVYDSKGTLLRESIDNEKTVFYNEDGVDIAVNEVIPTGFQRTEFSKDYDLEIQRDLNGNNKKATIKYHDGHEPKENGTKITSKEYSYEDGKFVSKKDGNVVETLEYDAKNHSWTIKDAKGKKVDSQNNMKKSHKVRNFVAGTTLAGVAIGLIGRGIYELSNKDDEDKVGTIAEDGTLTLDGKSYPENADGTYTIDGKKYKVEDGKLVEVVDTPDDDGKTTKVTLGDQEGTIDKNTGTITIDGTEYPKNPDDTYNINDKTYKLEGNKLVEVVDTPDDNGETGGADPDESPEVKGTIDDKEYTIKDGKVSVDGEELTPDENGHYTIGDDKYKIEDGKLVKVEPEESAKTDTDVTQSDDSQTGGGNTGDSSSGTTGSQSGGRTGGSASGTTGSQAGGRTGGSASGTTGSQAGGGNTGDSSSGTTGSQTGGRTDGSTSRTTGSQTGGRTDGSTSRTAGSQAGGRTDGSTSRTTGTTHNDTSRPVTTRPSAQSEESRVNSARPSAQSEESRANSVRHSAQSGESRANSVRHSERSEESRHTGNTPVTGVTEPTETQKQLANALQNEISGISTEADARAFFEKLKSALEKGQITTLQSDELLNLVQVHGETLHEVIKIQNEQDAIPEPEFGLGEVPTQQQPQPKAKREITPMERMELTESIRNARDRKDIEKIQKEMRKYKVFPGRKNLRRAYKAKLRAITHDGEQAKKVEKYNEKFEKRMEKIENSKGYKNDKDQINRENFQEMKYLDDIIKRPKNFDDGTFNA